LKNLCIFHHFDKSSHFPSGQVAHYNKTTLKNLCIFHHFWEIFAFLTTLKNPCIFYPFGKSLCFSPLRKIYKIFTWAGRPLQQDHFEKSLHFSPLWKISAFFTKNLRVFHLGRSPITMRPPLWKIIIFFISVKNLCVFRWVGHPWQFDHFKIFEFSKKKIFQFLLWVRFLALKMIHHSSTRWVNRISSFFFLYNAYYLKSLTRLSIISIVKRGGNCHHPILGDSPKFTFFKIKNQKIK